MTPTDIAKALIAAHQTGERAAPPRTTLTRDAILSLQSEVCDALGSVAGFKVGATDGLPIIAPIPAIYVTQNGAARSVRDALGVELEVGFELIKPLPAAELPPKPEDYFRPVVVLELVETRLTGDAADDPLYKFADLQINAGMVVGDVMHGWNGSDFGELTARLGTVERCVLDGATSVPGGSALAHLDLLLRHLGDHCGGLCVGQVAITGSVCGLPWFNAGDLVTGRIDGLGEVSIHLT